MPRAYISILSVLGIPRMFSVLAREGSGSLDIKGFAGRHTTRHCCSLLQYNKTNYQNGIYRTGIFLTKCNAVVVISGLVKPECEGL